MKKLLQKGGCNFMPSRMIGTGRKFEKDEFEEKANKLIYCIVSNINFPHKDHDKLFNLTTCD